MFGFLDFFIWIQWNVANWQQITVKQNKKKCVKLFFHSESSWSSQNIPLAFICYFTCKWKNFKKTFEMCLCLLYIMYRSNGWWMFCHKSTTHKPIQCLTQPEVHKQLQIRPELKVTWWPLNKTTLLDCKRSCKVSIYSISGNVNVPESMKMSWPCLGLIVAWCWVSCLIHVEKKKTKRSYHHIHYSVLLSVVKLNDTKTTVYPFNIL